FSHYGAVSATSSVNTAFQIMETPNNAQTITNEGKSRITDYLAWNSGANNIDQVSPFNLCGTFNWTSAGQKTLRLMYEQDVSGTIAGSSIVTDANANVGGRDVHWTVFPVGMSYNTPIFPGSVTSNSSGTERVERARVGGSTNDTTVCSSSPCTIHRQSGAWLTSVSRGGSGSYTLNIATGIFSGPPTCTFNPANNASLFATSAGTTTATSVGFTSAVSSTGTVTDTYFDVICMGPR
ncbi:MAG: hypothetical protein ACRCV5_02170, partial [Afipia sp.]